MTTLLQNLLLETLPEKNEGSILARFIETILPNLEQEFAIIPALGGTEERFRHKADQSLLVHVVNGLFIAWNLSEELDEPLTDIEAIVMCLGFLLHDRDKYYHAQGLKKIDSWDIIGIIDRCKELASKLKFSDFWTEWEEYLLDICYVAQNTQKKIDSNRIDSSWEDSDLSFSLDSIERDRLCDLLAFGDVAVHMNDPADLIGKTAGARLRECLEELGIPKKLVYHRLRDCRGLLTNQIHNAIISLTESIDWKPILFFAQGVIYLAPENFQIPNLETIQETAWNQIVQGGANNQQKGLEEHFKNGSIGFVRDGKGLKIAPITTEIFSTYQLICQLPNVIKETVKNQKDPATPKRLEKLSLTTERKAFLLGGADVWSDRFAEFIILVQREFFEGIEEYITWILEKLGLTNDITLEATKVQSGGVNYGWYQVAAHFIAKTELDRDFGSQGLSDFLETLARDLAEWANQKQLFTEKVPVTRQVFDQYLEQYLEIAGTNTRSANFNNELDAYTNSKVNNLPICSMSTGEFIAEDQLDSVVLFKPQQYSNKNALGGRRIKRGISKLWSLEMILRQAEWKVPSGKLEDKQPIFLYVFPAYVYSGQMARAIARLVVKLKRNLNLWEVKKQWVQANMDYRSLQNLLADDLDSELGRYDKKYSVLDYPFMAITHTETRGKTTTEAWILPAFLCLVLPVLLGVKVVATPSSDPLYFSDRDFLESVKLDGVAGFWNLLGFETSLRLPEIADTLQCLLIMYSLHFDNCSNPPDARWSAFNSTVRDVMTDILNVFNLAKEEIRRNPEDVVRYWKYAELLAEGDARMEEKLKVIDRLVQEYRQFYQVSPRESSYSILLPLSKALEIIISSPEDWDKQEMILIGSGNLYDALDRRSDKIYRPLFKDKTEEIKAIQTFMTTCVEELFDRMCKGDRAILQEHRNRIKSGAEFAYRLRALEDQKSSEDKITN
jgi:CRISPR-associated protein Csc3